MWKWKEIQKMPREIEIIFTKSKCVFYFILLLGLSSCKIINTDYRGFPKHQFDINLVGEAPDYSNKERWLEHPDKDYQYAKLPTNYYDSLFDLKPNIDVFFIHPTLYLKGNKWNAEINDKKLNKRIGSTAIKYQASVFLGIANIYAPHYRQMHIYSYTDLKNGYKAFEVAYKDVKNAFLYYWRNNNKSKKYIIAGHSQGTNHLERLLKEIILKNDTMKSQLLLAYLPGMPIKEFNKNFPVCETKNQINCFLSWRSLAEKYYPNSWEKSDSIKCTNPINWKTDSTISLKDKHLGILFKNHKLKYPNTIVSYNYKGTVWIKPIKIPFARFYKMKNYHIADYNLFWLNIRNNLRFRLEENGYN